MKPLSFASVSINLQFAKGIFTLKLSQSRCERCSAVIKYVVLFPLLTCLCCLILGHHVTTWALGTLS